jgi:serine/threonine protein kinase/formylglycine-generating enzyme required for sulfatase activity
MTDSEPTNRSDVPGPVPDDAVTRRLATARPKTPAFIGPFRVQSILGEGGMGTVYLVTQSTPIHRRVALKVVKPGMDSEAVVQRFASERQALAMMDHPNIAKVHDAGTTDDGRPYFVMEYVPGVPLHDYCERNRLGLKERICLFIDICHAVQHAHQKAVIHRDLKPSNILVSVQDSKPLPKIIDFGLAKALGHRLSGESLHTELGLLVGTPEYMSPEQADPASLDVDTRTDVYSLGVILYRLLTGSLPFDMKDLRHVAQLAALEAMRKRICETEPPKPSTRVSSGANHLSESAERVRIDPSILGRRLRGDLDWITMRALEKDRTRRYATAQELAADLQRHLDDEPVLAGPPGITYRLRKFVRKHSGAVIAVAGLFVLLLAGVVTSTSFYLRSELRRIEAERAQNKEIVQRKRAEDAEREALRAKTQEEVQRMEADAARADAEHERDKVLRLSDVQRLDQLQARALDLWPAAPHMIAPMTEWLAEAKALAANLEAHRSFLAELRTRTISGSGRSDPWTFSDTETQWLHDLLAELVSGLEAFSDPGQGTIASTEKRLAGARTIAQRSIEQRRAQWDEAIRSIADEKECPTYGGLAIVPQIGLVPLGRDRRSRLWEFGHLQSGALPERDEDGDFVIDKDTGLVFVLIPGGTYLMGAQKTRQDQANYDPQAEEGDEPNLVTLSPFFLSKFEMTQGQWGAVEAENPSFFNFRGPFVRRPGLHPVEQVSWEDCSRVMKHLGLVLPTEAQWEYAARAGTSTVWSTGAEIDSLDGAANLADIAFKENGGESNRIYEEWLDDGFPAHAPVGSFRPNAFGLHDVHGNVWEWCRDWKGAYADPVAPGDGLRLVSSRSSSRSSDLRIFRGGSYDGPASNARSARRNFTTPQARHYNLGLRPARTIEE